MDSIKNCNKENVKTFCRDKLDGELQAVREAR